MKNSRNIRQHLSRLTLAAIVVLTTAVTPVLYSVAQAQSTSNPSWSYTGNLNGARYDHSATLLSDGRVLVAGGWGHGYLGVESGAEIYDPASGTWSTTGSLNAPRFGHTAMLLPNSQVLVVGGLTANSKGLAASRTAELYDPMTGRWRASRSLSSVRVGPAVLLPNGKVLAVEIADRSNEVLGAELFDPATETWNSTGAPTIFGSLTLLPNGMVLVAGFSGAELYDPSTETWRPVGSLHGAAGSLILLSNGKVLTVAFDGSGPAAQLYNPSTETWNSTGAPSFAPQSTTLLLNGKVLALGYYEIIDSQTGVPNSAEIYDPVTGQWSPTAKLNAARMGYTVTPLSGGRVMVAGGIYGDFDSFSTTLNSAELYNPGGGNPILNQIDDAQFMVRQQYRDFLSREPDANGLSFWTNEIEVCGSDAQCIEVKRINVSAAFYLSIEFQQTGYLAYRTYKAAYGNLPDAPVPIRFNEFLPDTQEIGHDVIVNQAGWEQVLENNKQAFATEFVQRARFTGAFPATMTEPDFVDKLNNNAGNPLSQTERDQLVSDLTADAKTRADVLRAIAENQNLVNAEFNRAFVLMQYFGYLRRDPNSGPDADFSGYNFWLNKLDAFNGNFIDAEMVKAFISSAEYRQRFGQ